MRPPPTRPVPLPARHTVAAGAGILLLVDVLRVWLPSIITVFGQAAETPAELMGGFALLWFVLALPVAPLLRRIRPAPVGLAAASVLVAARLALQTHPAGQVQLYAASVGLLAGLVWLAALAAGARDAVPGLVAGLAVAALLHTALGTYDLVWRDGPGPWWLLAVPVVALLAAQASGVRQPAGKVVPGRPADRVSSARPWFLVGPILLLWGMLAGSPALAGTAVSYLAGPDGPDTAGIPTAGPLWTTALVSLMTGLFVAAGLAPARSRWQRAAYPPLLVLAAIGFGTGRPALLPAAMVLAAAGAGGCLALARDRFPDAPPARRALAAVAGMLLFAVGTIVHYAAYDIGYPNAGLPATVAVLVGLVAAVGGPPPTTAARDSNRARRRWVPATAVTLLLAVPAGLVAPQAPATVDRSAAGREIRLVAYNIRMGFGLDGRFDLPALVATIAGQRPDVVTLSEVDRAWLLNGGHDTLLLLAHRLGMRYHFAPAADPVWGDAVLTRLPTGQARTVALPAVGAPTGAQALAVVVGEGQDQFVVVSTHLQPPPGADAVVQARRVAEFATTVAAGRPLVVAGDLNTRPGDPAFEALRAGGLVDVLAPARPLATSPADAPRNEIDHVLVSPGVTGRDAIAVPGTASDHLAVAVTLTLSS